MRKTEIAKAINKGAPSGFLSTVLASEHLKLSKVNLAAFNCLHCNTQFASLSKTKPFCITCGSDEVVDLATTKEPEQIKSSKALSITCASCGTHNIINDRVMSSLHGHAHCITCGENLAWSDSADNWSEEEKANDELQDTSMEPDDLVFSNEREDDMRSAAEDHDQATQQERGSKRDKTKGRKDKGQL